MSTKNTPSVDEIRQEIVDRKYDGDGDQFDEDEFETYVDEYEERFGPYGDRGFAAWAAAVREYDVRVDSDYNLPVDERGSGSTASGDDVTISDIEDGAGSGDEEYVNVEGYVMDIWDDRTDDGTQQKKFRFRDQTGSTTGICTGTDSVQKFEQTGIERGDYVRFDGIDVYSPGEDAYILTVPPFVDIEFPEPKFDLLGDHYSIEEIEQEDITDEFVAVSGYVMGMWEDTTDSGNEQRKFRLRDQTGEITVMSTGDAAVENVNEAGLDIGDYVEIRIADVFSPADDVYLLSLSPVTEIEFTEPEFDLQEEAANFMQDVTHEGDLVYFEGIVSSYDDGGYQGCAVCKTNYDPDEERVCPKCGNDEMQEYTWDSLQINQGNSPVTVEFSPGVPFEMDDPEFEKIRVFGTFTKEQGDESGREYEKIDAAFYEEIGDDISNSRSGDTSTEDSSGDDEDVTIEDVMEEDEATESSGEDVELTDDQEDQLDYVVGQVHDFGEPMPGTYIARVLEKNYHLDKDDDLDHFQTIFHGLDDQNGILMTPDDDTKRSVDEAIDEGVWEDIYVEPV